MAQSRLAGFNTNSIDALIEDGVHMVYDHSLVEGDYWGWWMPNYKLIRINPLLKSTENKDLEDITILHEWLHAYDDIIIKATRSSTEPVIDRWAEQYRKGTGFAEYIRNNFKLYGF